MCLGGYQVRKMCIKLIKNEGKKKGDKIPPKAQISSPLRFLRATHQIICDMVHLMIKRNSAEANSSKPP